MHGLLVEVEVTAAAHYYGDCAGSPEIFLNSDHTVFKANVTEVLLGDTAETELSIFAFGAPVPEDTAEAKVGPELLAQLEVGETVIVALKPRQPDISSSEAADWWIDHDAQVFHKTADGLKFGTKNKIHGTGIVETVDKLVSDLSQQSVVCNLPEDFDPTKPQFEEE